MKRRLPYIVIFVVLVGVEVLIALTQHGNFIRNYGGDIIVMWVLYCLVQALLGGRNNHYLVNLALLVFAFAVELVQGWGFVDKFGIESPFLRTLIGTSFAAEDGTSRRSKPECWARQPKPAPHGLAPGGGSRTRSARRAVRSIAMDLELLRLHVA